MQSFKAAYSRMFAGLALNPSFDWWCNCAPSLTSVHLHLAQAFVLTRYSRYASASYAEAQSVSIVLHA